MMKFLRRWRQDRLKVDEQNARFIEELRTKLHDDRLNGWEQLKSRIDSLPSDDQRAEPIDIKEHTGHIGYRKWVIAAGFFTIILMSAVVLSLAFYPKQPKAVWVSMKPKEVSIASGSESYAFEDLFLDIDQAIIPLDKYPKGISRRLALRMSITGNAEGVSYYVEYRVQRPAKLDFGYAVFSYNEIMGMASQGYVIGDVFVRR